MDGVMAPASSPMVADEQHVASDPVQFAEYDPDVFGALGYFQAHELFDGTTIDVLVIEISDVIHPVEQGDYLIELFALAQFL